MQIFRGLLSAAGRPVKILLYAFLLILTQQSLAVTDSSRIVIAWDNAPRNFDPRYANDANGQYLENLLHCSLFDFDAKGDLIGQVAASWKWENSKLLNVQIKPNLTFSDGTPLTAQDVVSTFQSLKEGHLTPPSPRSFAFSMVEEIKAPSSLDVQFKLKDVDASFLTNLVVGILPSAVALKKEPTQDPSKTPTCGPFLLSSESPLSIILKRNPLAQNPPLPAEIEIKIVKDENTRFAKVLKGEVDLVQNGVSLEKIVGIHDKHPNLNLQVKPKLSVTYIGLNVKDPILGHLEVRRAIDLAVNKQAIIDFILHGMASNARTILPPNHPFFNPALEASKFDPEAAKALLDQAGFKQTTPTTPRFSISYKTTTDLSRIAIAKAIAADLKKIGIDVKVETLEWGRFKMDVDKGLLQMWGLNWIGFKDPDIYRFAFHTESQPPKGANRGYFSDKALDEILSQAKSTTDFETRKKLYFEAQAIIAKNLPYVFLFHDQNFAVVSQKLEGFELYADGRYSSLQRAIKK